MPSLLEIMTFFTDEARSSKLFSQECVIFLPQNSFFDCLEKNKKLLHETKENVIPQYRR